MAHGCVTIPWGREQLSFNLPTRWEVTGYCAPRGMPALTDVGAAVEQALARPLGHPPLRELIKPGARVALVVDDISRPTPAAVFIDRIIDAVDAAGIASKDVTLVFALGLHRAMTEAEMCHKIGVRAFGRLRCVNHNAYDSNELSELGRTSRGTRIALNKHVAAADVRILVGCVEPHVQAGFGGGFKNILPGVAAADSIGHNHYLGASPTHFSMIAWMPHTNPMRQDIEEFGAALPGETFAVNVVLNPDKQVVQVAAGSPTQVHLACINAVQTMYGVPVPAAADVVITSSAPLDVNLRQAVKGVANALFAAKPNGVILALSRCELGLDDVRLPKRGLAISGNLVRRILKLVGPTGIHFLTNHFPGVQPESRFFLYFALQAFRRNRVLMYSPNLARDLAGRRLPIPISGDLADLVRQADGMLPPGRVSCLIFPMGGVSYPIFSEAPAATVPAFTRAAEATS